MKSNLPEGWHWSTFKEVGKSVTGSTPLKTDASFYGGLIPWVKPPDLDKGKYVFQTPDALTEEGAENARLLPKGSVMISCIGNLGKVAIAGVDLCTNQQINSIIFNQQAVLSEYGYYYALTLKKWLTENSSATTIAIINKGRFEQAPIPVAPIAEQRRIVAQLDAVMQKLEASQERLDKLPDLLKKFRQAVLAAAVSGKLTEAWRAQQPQSETGADTLTRIQKERREWAIEEAQKGNLEASRFYKKAEAQTAAPIQQELPEGWSRASLLKVCQLVVDCHNKTAPYTSKGIPLIRTTNIKSGRLLLDSVKYVSPETYKFWSRRCPPQPGDILFTREAPMGESAIIPPDTTLCMGQRMMLLRFFKRLSDIQFFGYAIQSPSFLSQLGDSAVGTGVLHLRVGDVEALQVPVPPLAEQQEIARQINHYFGLADQLEARFEQAAALVEQLPQALLAKAFSGQLVPQDPDDEPASALLERLHAEPAIPVKGKRGRKAKLATDVPLFE